MAYWKKNFSHNERTKISSALSISKVILEMVQKDNKMFTPEWIADKVTTVTQAYQIVWGDLAIPDEEPEEKKEDSLEDALEKNPEGWEAV